MCAMDHLACSKMDERIEGRRDCPKRFVFVFLAFMGMFNVYAMRVNLSVAMVAMAAPTTTTVHHHNDSRFVTECANLMPNRSATTTKTFKGEHFDWGPEVKGLILGSFFYGYVLTQIPGGYLAERYGGKWFFGVGVLVTAIFSLLTPIAAKWGVTPFVLVRIIEGLGEGMTFPAMNALISRWAPKLERSRVSSFIFTGTQIGNVVAMPISGWLSSTDLLGGWSSVFYVFGTVGCVWFLFWAFLAYERPTDHPSISMHELQLFQLDEKEVPCDKVKRRVPWTAIFRSVPMWALVIAHFGHSFGYLILLTELPSYLSTILHFDVKENGLLSALPYIVQAVSCWIASYLADRIRRSGTISITSIRKIFNTIGMLGPAACLVGVTVSGCRPELIVGLITLAMALNACTFSGVNVTHVDMSPQFAGRHDIQQSALENYCNLCRNPVRTDEHGRQPMRRHRTCGRWWIYGARGDSGELGERLLSDSFSLRLHRRYLRLLCLSRVTALG
ncbi:sialin-like isoform X2 [Uloborus diversus]|uniref:sialin-like isoform X2 n=1 Tax=Uloborus diversus TaxID=327109 RepID=UPI002409BAB0|nr:sialin-like isoform X2 [Uloborus diversus]